MPDNEALREIIKERILRSGKIAFADFMTATLYHPLYGYYSSGRIKTGKRGDYYTSPLVHKAFGELLCRQMEEMWRITGGRDFVIVEMGAGDGTLCHNILKYAQDEYPSFYEAMRYIIIEESESMKELQRKRLTHPSPSPSPLRGEADTKNSLFLRERVTPKIPSPPGGEGQGEGGFSEKILWSDYKDPLFNEGITGCFLSNELVDAFPVHIVEMRGGELKEVYVGLCDDAFVEILDSPSSPDIVRYFERLGIEIEEGYRAEVNLRAIEWMRWVAKALKKGFVITIDYGYTAEDLYAPYRSSGTLLCYYRHSVGEDPYINIGEQDITSHVDFTTLMRTGEKNGLKTLGLTDQMHFLFGLGIGDRIEPAGSKIDIDKETEALMDRLMIKNLIMPGMMGNVFNILIQYKGLREPPLLSGLKKDPFTF